MKAPAKMLHVCDFIENGRNQEKEIKIGSIETEIYSAIKAIIGEEEERKKRPGKGKKTKK